jgi:hypothetical protein
MVLKMNTDGVASLPALTDTPNVLREANIAGFTITTGGVINITVGRVFCRPGIVMPDPDVLEWDGLNRLTIADEGVTAAMMADRTRTLFVPAVGASYLDGSDLIQPSRLAFGAELPDQIGNAYGAFGVPSDFLSGMTITMVVVSPASGDVMIGLTASYGATGQVKDTHTNSFSASATAVVADQRTAYSPLSLSNAAIGDIVSLWAIRDGTSGSDTIADTVLLDGWIVSYTSNG